MEMEDGMRLQVYNIDRANAIAHVALDTQYDRGMVADLDDLEPHALTKKMQPKCVFNGTIPECVQFVKDHT
jgi:hypothetical protein